MAFKVLPIKFKVKAPPIVSIRLKNRTLSPVIELFMQHLRAVATQADQRSLTSSLRDRG